MTLITRHEVLQKTKLSSSTLRRLISNGTFPPGVQISPRIRFWNLNEVDHWIDKVLKGVNISFKPSQCFQPTLFDVDFNKGDKS